MFKLFIEGGYQFMLTLTLLFIVNVFLIVRNFAFLKSGRFQHPENASGQIDFIKYLGTLILSIGILGQIVGLYSAFIYLEKVGNVSPALLAGGLKVSSIPTIYGLILYILSIIAWLLLKTQTNRQFITT